MHSHRRWMLMVLITIGAAVRAADPPDASSAESSIAQAEAAVQRAASLRALWTSAEDALRRARRALQDGNIALSIDQARIAQHHAELGIAQKDYPLFR